MNDTQNKHKSAELRRGVMTFLALAVLTAIEYVLGTLDNMTIPLVIIALIKAVLVRLQTAKMPSLIQVKNFMP